jgi:hypothetical protein
MSFPGLQDQEGRGEKLLGVVAAGAVAGEREPSEYRVMECAEFHGGPSWLVGCDASTLKTFESARKPLHEKSLKDFACGGFQTVLRWPA